MTKQIMRIFPEKIGLQKPTNAVKFFEQNVESFFKVFNASPGGMCLTEDSTLIEINSNFESMFGYSRQEALGQSNFSLVTIDADELQRIKTLIKTNGKLVNEEMTARHKDGHKVYCLVTTMPVVLDGGNFTLISFNDISRVKEQNAIIVQQHKALYDSANYAKRIQQALFPPREVIEKLLPESFILLKPKEVVTGDFYWVEKSGDKIFVAVADCTGHGVPGALMSIIGYELVTKLNKNSTTRPCDILNNLSRSVYETLRQSSNSHGVKDGIEISVIALDEKKGVLEFASARQAAYRVRGNELLKLLPDRFPIGIHTGYRLKEFNNQQIQVEQGDMIYLFTDGYSDQFGGSENKKFKVMQFQQLLMSIQDLSMQEQKSVLDKKLDEWKGEQEQIDDILIIGIRI